MQSAAAEKRFLIVGVDPFIGNSDTAEPMHALRVDNAKSQFFIFESAKDFDYDTKQHLLFDTYAFGADALCLRLSTVQILQNLLTDGRVGINDAADQAQLHALEMIENVGRQRGICLAIFPAFSGQIPI